MSDIEPTHTPPAVGGETRAPDPEVVPRAERRKYTGEYKLRILEEAEQCTVPGQVGALLRREGLYSSHLSKRRRQRAVMAVYFCKKGAA